MCIVADKFPITFLSSTTGMITLKNILSDGINVITYVVYPFFRNEYDGRAIRRAGLFLHAFIPRPGVLISTFTSVKQNSNINLYMN